VSFDDSAGDDVDAEFFGESDVCGEVFLGLGADSC
jgi:hypothetical protein